MHVAFSGIKQQTRWSEEHDVFIINLTNTVVRYPEMV